MNNKKRHSYHSITTIRSTFIHSSLSQNLLLVGSGLGLLLWLLSSRPRSRSHFFVESSSSLSSSALGSFLWIKLQKPPRTHPSPLLSRQHASRKSVTGDSSQ